MKPPIFQRGPRGRSRSVAAAPATLVTVVRKEHLERVLEARRWLGMDETVTTAEEKTE